MTEPAALAIPDSATREQCEWLAAQFEELPVELELLTPSEWAEQRRYLPPSVTPMPGYYSFDIAPYLREILDCFGLDSPIRDVSFMKGAQIGATTGVFENLIGYLIDHVKTAPVMLVTADSELAKLRMESNITPMLQLSDLDHLIKSADPTNARKTGRTDKKLEWQGGGFLIPLGAQNANKLRQTSIQILLDDEIDAWPVVVGKDGDPLQLARERTAAYEAARKVGDVSTPTIVGQSKIVDRFEQGDQRYYFVNCLECGHSQVLRWSRTNSETGEVTGIVWDMDDGRLVPGSVRYLCEECGHAHTNDDKTRLLSPENGAEWRPTAEPATPEHRSYHLSALYSPVGMRTWESCVLAWLKAWDVEKGEPKDLGQLQVFYNNVLGEPWQARGDKVRFVVVSSHRRAAYKFGEVPNKWAAEHCGGAALILTCSVDVHKDNLAVAVFAWCRGRRVLLVDYWRLEGNPERLDDEGTWKALEKLIEGAQYVADDGKRYPIAFTLIDSGYLTSQVYEFCSKWKRGVAAIKGTDTPAKNAAVKEFTDFSTPLGQQAFRITVDFYKDRWSAALKRDWDGQSVQPDTHFSAPMDATDAQLKELTRESKHKKIDKGTGRVVGFTWHRPAGSKNELWDLLVYADAALDIIAWNTCIGQFEMDKVDREAFENYLAARHPFFEV